jgi:hypothetical protein
MAKVCPNCEYVLGEFDTVCPRCKTDVSGAAPKAAPVAKAGAEPAAAAKTAAPSATPAPKATAPTTAPGGNSEEEDDDPDVDEGDGLKRAVKVNPMVAGGIGGACLLVYIVVFLLMGGSSKSSAPPPNPVETDVSALIGMTSKQVADKLGKPEEAKEPTAEEQAAGATDGTMKWKMANRSMTMTYHVKDSKVVNFEVETSDPSGKSGDLKEIENAAGVSETDPKYTILPVEPERGQFSGIKIVPK